MIKYSLIVSTALILSAANLMAQDLPRPSMIKKNVGALPTEYNFKAGPVLMNLDASLGGEFNDNIGLSSSGAQSDFIIRPRIGLDMQWPVTEVNTLRFDLGIGYDIYTIHPQYDTSQVTIAPNSALSFDVYTGDFKINFHDRFSWQQDPALVSAVNNVVNFSQFQNVAGIGVLWDLNQAVATLNYDHITSLTTQVQTVGGNNLNNYNQLDYNADQVSSSVEYHFTPTISAGMESAASIRYYDNNSVEDKQFSVGPFMKATLTSNLDVTASVGYQISETNSGTINLNGAGLASIGLNPAATNTNSTSNSYYANAAINHQLSRYYRETLSAGHELDISVFSQQNEVTYVAYNGFWTVNQSLTMGLFLNYQDVNSVGGFNVSSSYNTFTGGLSANFPVTKSISGTISYQYTNRFDAGPTGDYDQNRVNFLLHYHF